MYFMDYTLMLALYLKLSRQKGINSRSKLSSA